MSTQASSPTGKFQQIVWDIRVPRTLGAWAAGRLAGAGRGGGARAVSQPAGRPLFAGQCLGCVAGCGAGARRCLACRPLPAIGWCAWVSPGAAFVGAVLAVLLTLLLAKGVQHTLRLLLAGVIVGVVLGALTSLVMLSAPEVMQAMQAFMLGSTGFVGWTSRGLLMAAGLAAVHGSWPGCSARVLDGLSLGEATAASLGLPLPHLRVALVGGAGTGHRHGGGANRLIAFRRAWPRRTWCVRLHQNHATRGCSCCPA
jgi:iron complex transport system permease protein